MVERNLYYNSCRNRHCPKCQSLEQTRWVEAQTRNLLPVPYFHLVFTVPPALHPFFLAEKRGSYKLLFQAALGALHAVCQRRLGAIPGTIAVLHTWTQTLAFHPHVHCIVTGGGLSADRDRWIAARPGFLVPVRVLSRVFRGKLLEHFDHAVAVGSAGISSSLGQRLLQQAAAKEWVVYSKAPMAGPAQVLRYLGRYTHRIAIGNERLVALQDGRVTFRYRNRRRGNEKGLLTLDARLSQAAPTPRPPAFLAHRTLPLPIPPFVNPGRPSCAVSPGATRAVAPTANGECSTWSPRRERPNTREAHEALSTVPTRFRLAPRTALVCPRKPT